LREGLEHFSNNGTTTDPVTARSRGTAAKKIARSSFGAVIGTIGRRIVFQMKNKVSEMKAELTSAKEEEANILNGLADELFWKTMVELPEIPEKQRIKRPEAGKGR
jgi:hypothetical protein